jgi:hypothetical protein
VDGTYDNPLAPLETNKHCYSKDVESQPPQESKQGGAVLLFVHPAFGDPHLPMVSTVTCQMLASRRLGAPVAFFSPAGRRFSQVVLAKDYA